MSKAVYSSNILSVENSGGSQRDVPFVIMTSDDTHSRTLELLESTSYFGMKPAQLKLLKQVRIVSDNLFKIVLNWESLGKSIIVPGKSCMLS